jgi:hypothetical protein
VPPLLSGRTFRLPRLRPPRRVGTVAAIFALTVACSGGSGKPGDPGHTPGGTDGKTGTKVATTPAAAPAPELPRGGRRLFPTYRVVAYYGSGEFPGLGVLGRTPPDQAAAAIIKQGAAYAPAGRRIMPAMELITTVALSSPGPAGTYSSLGNPAVVQRYLDVARKNKMLLILDFQPGQGAFLPQVQRFESFLTQPDVGVALDSEWRMKPGQIPGKTYGSATAGEINDVSSYVAGLVKANNLPEKLFLVHQFRLDMLPDRAKIVNRPGLATVFHADGFGPQKEKKEVYAALSLPGPPFHIGFKLFYKADTGLMTPTQAMALKPQPDLITYQ